MASSGVLVCLRFDWKPSQRYPKRRILSSNFRYLFKKIKWLGVYGQELLREKIADTGRRFSLISYSDLVRGVDFHYPNINHGQAYRINIYDWSGLDRKIIGDCLGYISMASYKEAGFMASALVIGRVDSKPADNFFEWMEYLEILPDSKEETILRFWSQQVHYAHQWYKYGRLAPMNIETRSV